MSIVKANVVRDLGDKFELHIDAHKGGWKVSVVNAETLETISTGPHRFQLDGVIEILKQHWK
jgi:hypothetical protein